jgi:hypothetical protein
VTFILVEPGLKILPVNNEVTSVDKLSYNSVIGIYPNPSSGIFTVTNIPRGATSLEIRDLNGRTVYREEGAIDDTDKVVTADLVPGVYFITVGGKDFRTAEKLIIK